MDISSMVNKAVEAFKKDDTLKAQFLSDPVKALEKVLGVDLPDDQIKQVIDGVKKALGGKAGGGILAKIKSFFGLK